MSVHAQPKTKVAPAPLRSSSGSTTSGFLQRRCACGGAAGVTGECEGCRTKRLALQTKLAVNEPGDIYEQEADRVAGEVLARPARSTVSSAPPRIQRLSGHASGSVDAAPASVDHALASPGSPLDPALRLDMEPRFGHDFSQVRVHTDATAALSASVLSARAYTVGNHVAFAGNQFSPATAKGRRLLVHELAHVVQQSGGAATIQRKPETDDDDESAVLPARPRVCAGGAMPYQGVCLTDEILEVLPTVGIHAAERVVKNIAAEKRAQARVVEKIAKVSNAELIKKIDQMLRESDERGGAIPAKLRRLLKERDRRRALPISPPTRVDEAIAMLGEAWSLAEKEQPPDIRRASHLVRVVNTWLQKVAPPSRYGECFSGMARTTAVLSVGIAKGNVDDLDHKFRLGATIGGWWPATINSLKAARELVQIMSREKRIEETEFNAISKTINRAAVVTPLVGVGIMAAPAFIAGGLSVPAIPVIWLKTFGAAGLSASYLSNVVTRSKEAAVTEGGSNPLSIASASILDSFGVGEVVENIENESLLTGKPLSRSQGERAVGIIKGTLEFALNFFGAKAFFDDPVPQVKAPRRPATEPPSETTPSPSPAPVPQVVSPAPTAPPRLGTRLPRWMRSLVLSGRMTMQGAADSPIDIRVSPSSVGFKTPWKSGVKVTSTPPTASTAAPGTTTAPTQVPSPATAARLNTSAPTGVATTASAPVSTAGVVAPVATPAYVPGAVTIGVTPIGVHAENAAPLTSRRQLQTDVPEQGTQLGSQTQIGPEIVTAINGVAVTSRDPNILIGADTARFRADALAIILADANHPLAALVDYLTGDWVARPYRYGNMRLWEQNPLDWQAGHGISNRLGGADVIILQSTYRNQIQSARLERRGAVSKDGYYNIGGIAVDPLTAWDLYNRGLLPLPPTTYPKFKL